VVSEVLSKSYACSVARVLDRFLDAFWKQKVIKETVEGKALKESLEWKVK
jgi:hypothetical protein